jgi:hypothetical protein
MIYNYLISPSPAYFGQIEFIKVKKKKKNWGHLFYLADWVSHLKNNFNMQHFFVEQLNENTRPETEKPVPIYYNKSREIT